ncbi:dermonecrotic toxin domain-containing protein [Pseudomonas defluvii]|uniref:dermonecrotic toxin domain-containing protein n=1 Tax=Pseudomonas defluvii TaxID=1876757 RepID=UPI003906445C
MSGSLHPSDINIQAMVALQFASRPTLRSVLERRMLEVLFARYPSLARNYPDLVSASQISLMVPERPENRLFYSRQSLVDVFMLHFAQAKALVFANETQEAYRLSYDYPTAMRSGDLKNRLKMEDVAQALNELQATVHIDFQQALVDYWQQMGSTQVSRTLWLSEVLKTVLTANQATAGLGREERAALSQVVEVPLKMSRQRRYGNDFTQAYLIDIHVDGAAGPYALLSGDVLLKSRVDGHDRFLWCQPSGLVESFTSEETFSKALHAWAAKRFVVSQVTWSCYEPEENLFEVQASVLLNRQLEALMPLASRRFADVQALEQGFSALTDPSVFFQPAELLTVVPQAVLSAGLPDWLSDASASDQFAYLGLLQGLANAQAASCGQSFFYDVPSLKVFTAQALRDQLLNDHPTDGDYFADDLMLTFTIAEGQLGTAGMIRHKVMTLIEYAIGNLVSKPSGTVVISHRNNKPIMAWMTPEYIDELVQRVNIGEVYPKHVAALLGDPAQLKHRQQLFCRELEVQLPLMALQAKIRGQAGFSEAGYHCVRSAAQGLSDGFTGDEAAVLIRPLAFKRAPDSEVADEVVNFFVIGPRDTTTGPCVLYRPHDTEQPLLQFPSTEALFDAIKEDGALQASVLSWLSDDARRVYDNGGFDEPHIPRVIIDTLLPLERSAPARLVAVDVVGTACERLFEGNTRMLVELANRGSVSNAESRWALLQKGAWLVFGAVVPLLRGPVAVVIWIVQLVSSLNEDFKALRSGDEFQRDAAIVDVLFNLGLLLLHRSSPPGEASPRKPVALPEIVGPARRLEGDVVPLVNVQKDQSLSTTATLGGNNTVLDFSWSNPASHLSTVQREKLRRWQVGPMTDLGVYREDGEARGLYGADDNLYAKVAGAVYRVDCAAGEVWVVNPIYRLERGPRLRHLSADEWALDLRLALRGGGPKRQISALAEANKKLYEAKLEQISKASQNYVTEKELFESSLDTSRRLEVEKANGATTLSGFKARHEAAEGQAKVVLEGVIAKAQALQQTREDALLAEYKKQVTHLRRMVDIQWRLRDTISDLNQPQYAKFYARTGAFKNDSSVLTQLANDSATLHQRLYLATDWDTLSEYRSRVVRWPRSEPEIDHYNQFIDALKTNIQEQKEILDFIEQLDRLDGLLVEAGLSDAVATVRADRMFTTKELRFAYLTDLGELVMNRAAVSNTDDFQLLEQLLTGTDVKRAGYSNVTLAQEDVPLADRISTLNSNLEVYDTALLICEFLQDPPNGSVRADALELYKAELKNLKLSTEADLAHAIKDQELDQPRPPARPRPQLKPSVKARTITTRDQRVLVGEEVTEGDQVYFEQRNKVTGERLSRFHQHDDQWVEVVEQAQGSNELPAPQEGAPSADTLRLAREKANRMLTRREGTLNKLRGYLKKTDSLKSLEHIFEHEERNFRDAAQQLDALGEQLTEGDQDKIVKLREAADTLRQDLIAFYKASPPQAESLKYLYKYDKLQIARVGRRTPVEGHANDFIEKYEIRTQALEPLWEIHLHYPDNATPRRQFVKGHLKAWKDRNLGRRYQLANALDDGSLISIHRGDLTLADVDRILPFD